MVAGIVDALDPFPPPPTPPFPPVLIGPPTPTPPPPAPYHPPVPIALSLSTEVLNLLSCHNKKWIREPGPPVPPTVYG